MAQDDTSATLLVRVARAVAAAQSAQEALVVVLHAIRDHVHAPRAALLRAEDGRLTPVLSDGMQPPEQSMLEATLLSSDEGAFPLMLGGRIEGVVMVGGIERGLLERSELVLLPLLDLAAVALRNVRLAIEHERAEALERERARLDGVVLAARTAQHRVNNYLSLTVGILDLLLIDPRLPSDLRQLVEEAMSGAQNASDVVYAMQQVTRIAPLNVGGPGPVLDISSGAVPNAVQPIDAHASATGHG